jgi:hypothetical protein
VSAAIVTGRKLMTPATDIRQQPDATPMWPVVCLLAGGIVAYTIFLERTFLSVNNTMVFDPYVPAGRLIGNDLRITLSHASALFTGQPYYQEEPMPYPPLALLLLYPLTAISFFTAYRLVVILTVAGFVGLTVWLSTRFSGRPPFDAPALFLVGVGLLSYPFQFEIERGQWNVIAVALALGGVWLYQRRPFGWTRALACVAFVAGAHLKVYPALLAVAFWRRSESPGRNMGMLAVLGLLSALALLIGGFQRFEDFMRIVIPYSGAPYVWVGNHSIQAFATSAHISAVPSAAVVALMLGLVVTRLLRRELDGSHPLVLAALMLAMLLIPSTSHDYTLSVLPVAMALMSGWVLGNSARWNTGARFVGMVGVTVASAAYHIALVPYTAKTQFGPWSMNAHPELMAVVAILCVALVAMPKATTRFGAAIPAPSDKRVPSF